MKSDFVIVKDHPSLLVYIDSLQKKNAEQLSFYPKQAFEREQKKGRLFLGLLNGDPAGYIYVGARGGDVKCHQVCIQYDARRKLYGAMLASAMEEYASGSESVTLNCGFDLEANLFWKEMGYKCVHVREGGDKAKKKNQCVEKELTTLLD